MAERQNSDQSKYTKFLQRFENLLEAIFKCIYLIKITSRFKCYRIRNYSLKVRKDIHKI